MQWYIDVIKKYAVFDGRARRKEFWMFQLFNAIAVIILVILDNLIGTAVQTGSAGVLTGIYLLAVLVPNIAVSIRRMHDTNRGGVWYLINFVPCIGGIWFIVLAAQEGTVGDNQFGPDPKAAERAPGAGEGFGQPGGPAEPGYPTV
jgi:uncharacterized membrane protein YhaH (DUF805 family)